MGPHFGKVKVSRLTIDEATEAVRNFLQEILTHPEVSLTLFQSQVQQPISGEYLVAPDGSVNLGTYGRVKVAGMTLDEARAAVEEKLAATLDNPRVSVTVFAYNSKVYYVITESLLGIGDQVARLPITGSETVLDALSEVKGLTGLSSKKIWIARPAGRRRGPR